MPIQTRDEPNAGLSLLSNIMCLKGKVTRTKTKISFWLKFHHLLHRKLCKWKLPVQPMMKISKKNGGTSVLVHHCIRTVYPTKYTQGFVLLCFFGDALSTRGGFIPFIHPWYSFPLLWWHWVPHYISKCMGKLGRYLRIIKQCPLCAV